MSRPILEPGRPGDLQQIAELMEETMHEIQRTEPFSPARVRACAEVTHEALSMWLGLIPVAEEPTDAD